MRLGPVHKDLLGLLARTFRFASKKESPYDGKVEPVSGCTDRTATRWLPPHPLR